MSSAVAASPGVPAGSPSEGHRRQQADLRHYQIEQIKAKGAGFSLCFLHCDWKLNEAEQQGEKKGKQSNLT